MDNSEITQNKIENLSSQVQKIQKIENPITKQQQPKAQLEVQPNLPSSQQHSSIPEVQEPQQAAENQQGEGENNNDDNWTDATESIAPDDQDDIWVVDDDIVNAMEEEFDQEGGAAYKQEQNEDDQEGQEQQQSENSEEQEKVEKNQLDFTELQEQFVVGRQSNQNWRLGQHAKFCTCVCVSPDGKSIFTGGGDDFLLCFRKQGEQWKQFYRLKHSQTIYKIELSHDGKYVLSLTENQAFCTQIQTLDSRKFDVQEPTDLVTHKQGGVALISHGYTISIYNLKGLSQFTSYTLDLEPTIITFCDKGKQIIAACDNKLRIITPKNGQIVKSSGEFHKEQISAVATANNLVYTGCIEGRIFITNLSKGTVMSQLQPMKGSINLLTLTDNNQYLVVAPQGEGLYWFDSAKLKKLFVNPKDISISDVTKLDSSTIHAISEIQGKIHLIDRRNPLEIIKSFDAGNSIHKLYSRGSEIYAACEDGFMRVFDIGK